MIIIIKYKQKCCSIKLNNERLKTVLLLSNIRSVPYQSRYCIKVWIAVGGNGSSNVLPPSQIISHSKNLGESKFFKFDEIYIAK